MEDFSTDATTKTPFTVIVPDYPGYTFEWVDHRWVLSYTPLKGVYSPPVLHPLIKHFSITVPDDLRLYIGLVIGCDGVHFKNITRDTKSTYIFYRSGFDIDVWTYNTDRVCDAFQDHFEHIRRKLERQDEYSMHVPIPLILHDHIGRVIGKNGHNLKKLTTDTGCRSIVYRSDSMSIEIHGVNPARVIPYVTAHLERLARALRPVQ